MVSALMFVSPRRHRLETDRLTAELSRKDEQIAALERRLVEAERTRHELVEEVRYVIEAGGLHVESSDRLRGERLKSIGHVLPYLLSGRRQWHGPELPEIGVSALMSAKQLAAEYGFTLPDDPVDAVKAMLDLALALFNPVLSLPLQGLQNRHPPASATSRLTTSGEAHSPSLGA